MLFEDLNSYHQNIKSTVEVNQSKFLDTKLIREKVSILTQVFIKPDKFSVRWSYKIPIRYKRNVVIGELQRAKRIAFNSYEEIQRISQKFHRTEEETIIPKWFFGERKIFTVRLPHLFASEKFGKLFVKKVEDYTYGKVKLVIIWNTRKIQFLFNNKDNIHHHSRVIYHGVCSCGADYVGETIRNSEIR